MLMHGAFKTFLSLALGYAVCVAAKKQEGLLKTVGYVIGISILVLSLVWGTLVLGVRCPIMGGKISEIYSKMCPMMSQPSSTKK